MGSPISIREFARQRGVSHTAIRKAIAAGRISVTPEGKIDPDVAGPELDLNTDHSKRRKQNKTDDPSSADTEITDPLSAAKAYQKARAQREQYAAKTAQLTYEQKAGALVSSEQVKAEAFQAARITRDSLLNIPNKISHELAAEADPAKIHAMLTKYIHQSLEELAAAGRRNAGLVEQDPTDA